MLTRAGAYDNHVNLCLDVLDERAQEARKNCIVGQSLQSEVDGMGLVTSESSE